MLTLVYSLADQNFARGKSLGILNVSLDLARVLARRPEISQLAILSNKTLRAELGDTPNARLEEHNGAGVSRLARVIWDQFGVYRAAKNTGCQWLFLPKGYASFARKCPVRLAAYVHDAMVDHYRERYPQAVSGLETWYFERSLAATLRQSSVIFCNSDFTASEVRRLAARRGLKCPAVVTAGVGFSKDGTLGSRIHASTSPRRGLVILASRWPHKLTRWAVEQMHGWQSHAHFAEPIHWIGSLPDGLAPRGHPNWRFLARPPNDVYGQLMGETRAVVFTSEYEGFGMPPVEAALAGACPVYSDIPATREAMAGLGCPFDNNDAGSFARALDLSLTIAPDTIRSWSSSLQEKHSWAVVSDRVVKGLLNAS